MAVLNENLATVKRISDKQNQELLECQKERDTFAKQVTESKIHSSTLNENMFDQLHADLSALQLAEQRWRDESEEKIKLAKEVFLIFIHFSIYNKNDDNNSYDCM